jgi:hypothetical protein
MTYILGIPLLTTYIVWPHKGLTNEEDGKIESHQVIVAIFSIKFRRESTRVTSGVRIFTTICYCAESCIGRRFLSGLKEGRFGEMRNILGNLEISKGTATARVYYTFL